MGETVYTTDPQKGQWGGHSRRNDRELTATIAPDVSDKGWYRITLMVRSTDASRPLAGDVRFHLHPTFETPMVVPVEPSGVARIELLAWGSFTVGAEADAGRTKLELDLSDLPDAPEQFRLM